MLVLKAKEKMSYNNRTAIELELSSKLNDDVVIIPEGFDIVHIYLEDESKDISRTYYLPYEPKIISEKKRGCKCNG